MGNYLSVTEFAKLAGVSRAAISKAVLKGRLPSTNGKIDIEHPDPAAYVAKHRGGPSPASKTPTSRSALEIAKLEQQVFALSLQNMARSGESVLREDVMRAIVDPINTTFVRLLTDLPRAMAGRVVPMVQGGADEDEIEAFIRNEHSSTIKYLKAAMKKALRKGQTTGEA